MSCASMKAALYARGLTPTAKLVLIYLCDRANAASVCWPSTATISKDISASQRAVGLAIVQLKDKRFIEVNPHRRHSNTYRILPLGVESSADRSDTEERQIGIKASIAIASEASVSAKATTLEAPVTAELIGNICASTASDHGGVDRQILPAKAPVDRQILPTESYKKESPKEEGRDPSSGTRPSKVFMAGSWVDVPVATPANPWIERYEAMGSPDRATGDSVINGFDIAWTTEEACLAARASDRIRSRHQIAIWLREGATPSAIISVLRRISRKPDYRPPNNLSYFGKSEVMVSMMRDEVRRDRLEATAI